VLNELTIMYATEQLTDATVWPFAPSLRVQTPTGERVATVVTVVSDLIARTRLLPRLTDLPDAETALREVLVRWSVSRLERILTDPLARQALLNEPRASWKIGATDPGEVDELLALIDASKACTHQQADGRDLLCLAASSKDETAIGITGWRRVAPTSWPLCAGCQMPDAAVVCSHLSHPEVVGLRAMSGQVRRQLAGALCNLGRDEIQQPGGCHAGGHGCWQRVVGLEVATPTEIAHPRALTEILDALDAWWRLAVVNKPLLRLDGGTSITGLAMPCTSRAEFTQRLSELAVVLGSLRVDDDQVRPGLDPGADLPRKDQSVARLRACLKAKIADPDSLERANQALGRLARLQRIRSLLQHPSGYEELVRVVAGLGLAWPPADWAAAWERVRAEAADALAALRNELRMLAEMAG
jgi:hypothetical protein